MNCEHFHQAFKTEGNSIAYNKELLTVPKYFEDKHLLKCYLKEVIRTEQQISTQVKKLIAIKPESEDEND